MTDIIITNNDVANGRYLCYSSLLFLIPSAGCCYYNIDYVGQLGIITTGVSINLWRKFEFGWRRNWDLICSRIMCIVISFYFLLYSKSKYDIIYSIILLIICAYLYNSADFNNNKFWYKYHITFHICLTFIGLFTIYKIINFYKKSFVLL
uniref:Uncharacterized protein n=1 Tax=Florenciella sp. virus SA2 TaxID=3240092 RepID=A0AB39JFL7_9VIRU